MKRFFLLAFFCVLLSSATLSPQTYDVAQNTTGPYFNGRAWEVSPPDGKLGYVFGFIDGIIAASNKTPPELFDPSKFTYDETVKQITDFYVDSSNAPIPIPYAYVYTIKKRKGATSRELEDYVVYLRRIYNK